MADIDSTIADLHRLLKEQEEAVRGTKRTINSLLAMAGRDHLYSEAEIAARGEGSLADIRGDKWYGQPLAKAVREYLAMRRAANLGPATIAEIHDALAQGGFVFEAKTEDYAKRGLRQSLSKNTSTFHKLPGTGKFGLTAWYPNAKHEKPDVDTQSNEDDTPEDEEGG